VPGVTERYRHGKLVEWTMSDGRRYALTGSPNLSYAALATPEGAGNTEVAILSSLDETLFPASASLDLAEVPHVVIPAPEEVSKAGALDAPRVSSAILTEGGLAVWLTRRLAGRDDTRKSAPSRPTASKQSGTSPPAL